MTTMVVTLAKIGLILNTIGAILFLITSNSEGDRLIKILGAMKATYGRFDSNRAVPAMIDELINIKNRNTILNKIGWALFLVGLIMQFFDTEICKVGV